MLDLKEIFLKIKKSNPKSEILIFKYEFIIIIFYKIYK